MVRLSDMHEEDRAHLLAKACPAFETEPWVEPPPLDEARVAIVTTAGLQRRADRTFAVASADYRVIPGDVEGGDLIMSHTSVNFDRSGFQQDVNVVFPVDRLRELEGDEIIGSLARYHYSFMGAFLDPADYESSAREVAGHLKDDGVNVVFLTPI